MKKNNLKIFMLFILFLLFLPYLVFSKPSLTTKDGQLVLYVEGSPRERGLQQGKFLSTQIKGLLKDYLYTKVFLFVSPKVVAQASQILLKNIDKEYIEEMQGIAEGAGVKFEEILYLHTFLDIFTNPNQAKLKKEIAEFVQCSNFAAFGAATKGGVLIHGRNLDWMDFSVLYKYSVITFVKPDKGIPFVSIGWPGAIGVLSGMNKEQISIGQMLIKASDNSVNGVPHAILLRKVLQYAKNLKEAVNIITKAKRTTGWNILISSGKEKNAVVLETSATQFAIRKPVKGVIWSTNQFVDKKMALQHKIYPPRDNSISRFLRLKQLLKKYAGKITYKLAISFLQDHYNPILKKESPHEDTICQPTTIQSIVFLPQTLEFYVSHGIKAPVPHGKYVHYYLKDYLK